LIQAAYMRVYWNGKCEVRPLPSVSVVSKAG
jgi:hypothetical protein